MSTLTETFVDLPTTRGDMRVHLFVPQAPGRHPGVVFYSEIFQVTNPIRRMASALSGHGYVVAVTKGGPVAVSEVDRALARMRADGTMHRLARQWLGIDPARLRPLR